MKTIRIRKFTILSLFVILIFPWIFYVGGHFFETKSFNLGIPTNSKMTQIVAGITGLFMAFLIVAYAMRRYILIPLEKMSLCARQIAEGDLDIQIPSSKISEIAEVHDGFILMVDSLKKSFQKQVELEDERRFVIAAVAHDIRTPLFALRGYLEGLEQGIADSPEKRAKYLAVCKEKSAQLDRLVEELFTFAKTEYQEMILSENIIDLSHVLKNSIESLSHQAEKKDITIIADNLTSDCNINGDSDLLERAMNNLIDNAVRHTPTSGKIFIDCYRDETSVIFTIQDTGEGFFAEELQRVFEPLYRGEASRNRSTGGAGLGLTISQRIIRQHGGELVVGNHPEGGAFLKGWIPI
ncbi:sensor histidine kinase [Robertmurraya yapensis]|uniref:histidine kinase n=1 Tax=Bacillus yapensis TaxID=2492960 RepID=A0A431WJ70_9BACI|nr:HAMP domain-containing sensor histidine kinase [Bacillus yapensis]RTR35410.1 sensor histidine kinase [Bacillus yapensis]TKS97919.1 HAMP domain-containing protein [Bacillus yapensis]